ncbi:MAG: DegV family EDD domain-containing protein [Clostridia bacterium]|nr:DegV family EDD domain-containing protein [Clostridia bacterium]
MEKFLLSCESCIDMPYEYIKRRNVSVLFYTYEVNGEVFYDDMGEVVKTKKTEKAEDGSEKFWNTQREGVCPVTSPISQKCYYDYFEKISASDDVLHISLGSGISKSFFNALSAAKELMEKYPERKIAVLDTHCLSGGYGMAVDLACDLRDGGCGFDELSSQLSDECRKIHHRFFTSDLSFLRKSGRLSSVFSTVASALGSCQIMQLDFDGNIVVCDKVRGENKAVEEIAIAMAGRCRGGFEYADKCFICHSDNAASAEALRTKLEENFEKLTGKIKIFGMGPITGAHCGPGTVALFFFGEERQ